MFNIRKYRYINNSKVLIFIGSPRTGSTLLGQLINYHPQCLIANEYSLITKVVKNGKNYKRELKKLYDIALEQFNKGLENCNHFGKTINIYQPKWKNMSKLARNTIFEKKDIRVIGDKKAGGTIKTFLNNKNEVINFFNKHSEIITIQILRHPIDAAKSYMKSHNISTFEEAINYIMLYTYEAYELSKMINNKSILLYYEDLISNSEDVLKSIFNDLNLDISQEWLSEIVNVITKDKNQGTYTEKEIEIYMKLLNNFLENKELFYKYQ